MSMLSNWLAKILIWRDKYLKYVKQGDGSVVLALSLKFKTFVFDYLVKFII